MILPGMPRPMPMRSAVPYLPIPAMTSDSTPSGWVAFSNAILGSSYESWKAFDKIETGFWGSSNVPYPHHVGLSAPSRFKVVRYAIVCNSTTTAPANFVLQGSNDGAAWDELDARSGVAWTSSFQRQEWEVASPDSYSRYRILVSATGGGVTRMTEVELLQEADL